MLGRAKDDPALLMRQAAELRRQADIKERAAAYLVREQRPFSGDDDIYEGTW